MSRGADDRLWVDQLSPESLRRAIAICRREGIARIEFLEVHPVTGHRARRATIPDGLTVSPIDYELSTLRAPSGRGLYYELGEMVAAALPSMLERQLHGHRFDGSLSHLTDEEVFTALLRTAAGVVYPAVGLALIARACGSTAGTRLLLVHDNAMSLAGSWPVFQDQPIRTYGGTRRAASRGLAAVRAGALAARELLGLHLRGIAASERASTDPCVAVQLQPRDGDEPVLYPWYPGSGISASQVCVYADRPDAALTSDVREQIVRRGHRWIAFRSGLVSGLLRRPYVTRVTALVRDSVRIVYQATRSPDPLAAWEATARIWLLWRAAFWEALFRRHRVVAVLHFSDTGAQMVAQAAGLRLAGGMSIGWHWSHLPFTSSLHARCCSTFFSWGPFYRPVLEGAGLRVDRLIYAGQLPFRASKPLVPSPAARLRQAGATYVVCFFDSAPGSLVGGGYSRKATLALYERLLREVVRSDGFGLVIKPKDQAFPAAGELSPALAAARASGRLCELPFDTAPQDAGAGADLVVGYAINSAAMECALDRKSRVIYADLDGAVGNPFYDWGRNRVVFDSIDGVMDAVARHRADPLRSPVGDHGVILRRIDPFGDGSGHRRLGWYLKTYLDGMSRGEAARTAMSGAADAYRRRYGADTVVVEPHVTEPAHAAATC